MEEDKERSEKEKSKKERFEQEMSQTLEEGEFRKADPAQRAQDELIPRYEIRIPVSKDPIVEETRIIRSIVREIDSRYDEYISPDSDKKKS
jgi:hypothetical protein